MPTLGLIHEPDGGSLHRLARRRRRGCSPRASIDGFLQRYVEWITCEPNILDIAARIKGHGKLSVADSWIGATAIAYGATLVHEDPEFEPFKEIPQEVLK